MDSQIRILQMIAKDMEDDAKHYDGQAFNRRNVAAYFGKQGAAIAKLANIMEAFSLNKRSI